MISISSLKDPRIVAARALHNRVERQRQKKRLLFGWEAIRWAQTAMVRLECLFVANECDENEVPIYRVSEGILRKISDTTYVVPVVGVMVVEQEGWQLDDLVIVLDHVHDPGNVGTIIRTAAGFGIQQVVAIGGFDLFQRKCVDASRGAVFSSRFQSVLSGEEACTFLQSQGYQIAVTTPYGSQLQSLAPLQSKPLAIVFGNENEGVSREVLELADLRVAIPMHPAMESLNVGVAAGITLYELKTRVVLSMLTGKIRSSLGRNLGVSAHWVRRVFDHKLQAVTPITADQAIALMVVQCDRKTSKSQFQKAEVTPLIQQGYLRDEGESVSIAPLGAELLAKIWPIHEIAEALALQGLSEQERSQFNELLVRIQDNCAQVVPFD